MSSCCQINYRPKIGLSLLVTLFVLIILFSLHFTGLFSFTVNSGSSLFAFFVFGIIAGLSTCSPITGSLFISFSHRKSSAVLFLISRVIAFSFFGLILGLLGSYFQQITSHLGVIGVVSSIITLLLALNFLKIIKFKSINFHSASPLIAGMATFFVPCGFTLTAQSISLTSASPLISSLILFLFSLGTIIPLLPLLFSVKKINSNPVYSAYFSQISGFLLLFFSLYTLNSSLSLLSLPNISLASDISSSAPQTTIKMLATSSGYHPNYFQVRAGQLIRWEIQNQGASSCTDVVIAKTLLEGEIKLQPSQVSVKEFIAPSTPGIHRFSCWMGMISGTIEVVK